jgi:hypothetical protein
MASTMFMEKGLNGSSEVYESFTGFVSGLVGSDRWRDE